MSELKLKKTKLGKKRLIEKAKDEPNKIKEEIIFIRDNTNLNQKDNTASFLLKLILKGFYLSLWKKKIKALKYYSRKTNKQRMNFKKLINEISLVINQQKYNYLNEIIEKIDKLPLPKNIKHDKNFGTIKIVNKDILNKKKEKKETKEKNKDIKKHKNQYIKDINYNNEKYVEVNKNNIIDDYEDGNKEMDFNNNDFKEDEYNTYENINDNNINYNNQNILPNKKQNYNENEIEEDEAFIENEYDYKQDLENEYNYYNNKDINNYEYYQENSYYNNNINNNNNFYENENNYIENDGYDYNDEMNIPNNYLSYNNFYENNDFYYPNQYDYYYNEPNEKIFLPYKDNYYAPLNKVNYIKTSGNNVLINDVYMKPRINNNQMKYYYNNNNSDYYSDFNQYQRNRNIKRAFPSWSHNHVFYISKK